MLKRIDLALQELYKKKLLTGQTFQMTRDLFKPELAPRKNPGPQVTRPFSEGSTLNDKPVNSGRPKSVVMLPANTYVGPPAPSPASKGTGNSAPFITPKPRIEPNSFENPIVPNRVPYATPPPSRAPLPTPPPAQASKPQGVKSISPVKPALPSKLPPSLKQQSQRVDVSLDPAAASSLAKTAYTSGAAKTIIQGSKPTFGPGGVSVKVDPEAAKKAAMTMHNAGATGEIVGGLRVNTPPPTIPSTSSKPKRMIRYKAVRAFVAEQEGDLPLRIGDSVYKVEEVDENWYRGESEGNQGIFPKNFVVAELE